MNTRQLQYALELAKLLNFSQVAEKLNISQPALSKQILNLEKDIGIKIFDRNSTPIKITPAGEYFLREAQELLYKENQLIRSLDRFKSGKEGRLTIGISPFRSSYLMPSIAKKIQERFPGIQIFLREANSTTLRKEVAEGKYDFAIINLPIDESILDVTPIEPDTLVLTIPNTMLHLLSNPPANTLAEIDFKSCKELPFIVVGQTQEMRQLFDKLCAQSDFHPQIAMEVVGLTTAWAMSHSGIGATLLPLQFLNEASLYDNVSLFKIKNNNYLRQPAVVTRRDQYISDYAKYAINLLTNKNKY